jgi:hypothetical protein
LCPYQPALNRSGNQLPMCGSWSSKKLRGSRRKEKMAQVQVFKKPRHRQRQPFKLGHHLPLRLCSSPARQLQAAIWCLGTCLDSYCSSQLKCSLLPHCVLRICQVHCYSTNSNAKASKRAECFWKSSYLSPFDEIKR